MSITTISHLMLLIGMGIDDCALKYVRLDLCSQVIRRLHWREPLRRERERARAQLCAGQKVGRPSRG